MKALEIPADGYTVGGRVLVVGVEPAVLRHGIGDGVGSLGVVEITPPEGQPGVDIFKEESGNEKSKVASFWGQESGS